MIQLNKNNQIKLKIKKMKRLLSLLLLIVFSSTIYAQTEKNKVMVSGGTGLQFLSSKLKPMEDGVTQYELTTNSISILPSIGYFIIDNLSVGLAANITSTSTKYDDYDPDVLTSIFIIPTAVYFVPMDGEIRPLGQFGVGLASISEKEGDSAMGFALNIGGGVAYFIKENISVNGGLSYTMARLNDSDNENVKVKQGNFGANLSLSLFF